MHDRRKLYLRHENIALRVVLEISSRTIELTRVIEPAVRDPYSTGRETSAVHALPWVCSVLVTAVYLVLASRGTGLTNLNRTHVGVAAVRRVVEILQCFCRG